MKNLTRLLLGWATLVATSSALAQKNPGPKPSPLDGLDAYIESVRQAYAIPGMAVGIVRNDTLVYARGFGLKELGKPDSVTPRTVFAIGSNTKSFTTTAAAILVDEGKLNWNDKVTRWLPGFQLFDPYVTRELTLRDVLSHRSGLGRRGDALWYGTSYSRDEVLRRIRYLPPNAGFRTEMGYQNIMFLAGGQVVAAAAGASYDDVIRTKIFEPLGMTSSSTSAKAIPSAVDVSTPHSIENGKATVIHWRDLDNVAPAGSINSNVVDMARYLRMHLGNGTIEGKRVVTSANLGVTKTPHINAGGAGDSVTHFVSYGLGWVLLDYRGKKIAWHNGGIDGMLSEMWTVPEAGLGIVVLTNGSPHSAGPAVVWNIIDRVLLGAPSKDWLAEGKKQYDQMMAAGTMQEQQREKTRAQGTSPSLALEKYAGTYADTMYGDLVVTFENGNLVSSWQNQKLILRHWHYNTFRGESDEPGRAVGGGKPFLTFQIDAMGKASKVDVEGLATFLRSGGS